MRYYVWKQGKRYLYYELIHPSLIHIYIKYKHDNIRG